MSGSFLLSHILALLAVSGADPLVLASWPTAALGSVALFLVGGAVRAAAVSRGIQDALKDR